MQHYQIQYTYQHKYHVSLLKTNLSKRSILHRMI